MSPDFWIGLAVGLVATCAAIIINAFRPTPGDIWDWKEQAYEPDDQPRAITRIRSNDIDWEIRP